MKVRKRIGENFQEDNRREGQEENRRQGQEENRRHCQDEMIGNRIENTVWRRDEKI